MHVRTQQSLRALGSGEKKDLEKKVAGCCSYRAGVKRNTGFFLFTPGSPQLPPCLYCVTGPRHLVKTKERVRSNRRSLCVSSAPGQTTHQTS